MIEGFVYFVKSDGPDGFIKIGFSKKPDVRIKALQTGSGYPVSTICVLPGTSDHESHLHKSLALHRIIGEWFADCEPVQDAIASAISGDWYGYATPEQKDLSGYAAKAFGLASYLKSAAEYAGLWNLKKGPDNLIFGFPTWKVWKFYYRNTEPTIKEIDDLLAAKRIAASILRSLAQDAFEEADEEIKLIKEEREDDEAFVGDLEALNQKFDAYFADRGIVRPSFSTTPEEDAEIRIEFEARLKRESEKRQENLLAKIAERKSA